jgi:hypothetical protein
MAGESERSGQGADERVGFIAAAIDRHIKGQFRKRRWNKRMTYILRTVIVALGALTTVVLGAKGYLPADRHFPISEAGFSVLALILSALGSGVAAWDALAQPGWKWIRARMMFGLLAQMKDDLEFRLKRPDPLSDDEIQAFYDRLKSALEAENEAWAVSRATAISGVNSGRPG